MIDICNRQVKFHSNCIQGKYILSFKKITSRGSQKISAAVFLKQEIHKHKNWPNFPKTEKFLQEEHNFIQSYSLHFEEIEDVIQSYPFLLLIDEIHWVRNPTHC